MLAVNGNRHGAIGIGVARADNSNRKAMGPVTIHQIFFSCNLLAGILPEWIAKRCALRKERGSRGLLVCGSSADKDELSGLPAE